MNIFPDETLEQIKENLIAIKGPLMTPVGESFRSINVTLRQKLDLYACVRPVEYFTGIKSPVRAPEKVNMTIFRENTEDIYAGIEFSSSSKESKKLINFWKESCLSIRFAFQKLLRLELNPLALMEANVWLAQLLIML